METKLWRSGDRCAGNAEQPHETKEMPLHSLPVHFLSRCLILINWIQKIFLSKHRKGVVVRISRSRCRALGKTCNRLAQLTSVNFSDSSTPLVPLARDLVPPANRQSRVSSRGMRSISSGSSFSDGTTLKMKIASWEILSLRIVMLGRKPRLACWNWQRRLPRYNQLTEAGKSCVWMSALSLVISSCLHHQTNEKTRRQDTVGERVVYAVCRRPGMLRKRRGRRFLGERRARKLVMRASYLP